MPDINEACTDCDCTAGRGGMQMINSGMMSSKTSEWSTPQDLFDRLNAEFGPFDLDPCATKGNAKCEKFFSFGDYSLDKEWTGRVFMNPPYGREIGKWIEKAYRSARDSGALVVCLLPARTDTRWWHDYCMKGTIRFLRGRLKFGGCRNSAPFPSAVVIFGMEATNAQT